MKSRHALGFALLLSSCASFEGPTQPKIVIFFGHDSTAIDGPARSLVSVAAKRAAASPSDLVTVAGYAAANGDPDADAKLAAARAQDVAQLLEQDGVAASRLQIVPRPPSNEPSRIGARRVEITVGDAN